MSKTSKHCRKAKNELRKSLEKFAQEQINEFLVSSYTIDDYLEECQDDFLDDEYDDYPDDEIDRYWLEYYDDYDYSLDDDFDTDEYDYLVKMEDNPLAINSNVGKYFKYENKTYLCAEVHGYIVFIDVHTGRELKNTLKLKEVG